MKPVVLVGGNGDHIDLTSQSIYVAPGAEFGTTRPAISYRTTRYGRRVERLQHDLVRSSFAIRCQSSDPSTLDNNRARVVDALRSRVGSSRVMLVCEQGDGTRRAQIGVDVGTDPVSDSAIATVVDIPVVLESVDSPYWFDLEASVITTTIGVETSVPWVGEMPIGANVPIGWPWSLSGYYIADANAQTLNVSNDGPLPTWPIWEITGPATSLELAHERTGKVWAWAGTLSAGETLRITTDPKRGRTVEIDTAAAWADVDIASEMSELLPGDNQVQVRLTGGTDPNTTVTAQYNSRHTSP